VWRSFLWEKTAAVLLFSVVAIVFNPIAPIHFTRATWEYLDLIGSALFLIAAFLTGKFPPLEVSG
jgi:hypothetical protein